ncbi:hypothetical protein [Galbibacter sp. PAP.153]|uniref:hypothetical protein n=1 Tax=Galbibacter sp. PAP.153 TaxID=3104623 RepID=UPI00300A13E0
MFVFRNRCFSSSREYSSREIAKKQFEYARQKLFKVNQWSFLSAYIAKFIIYDPYYFKPTDILEVGSYIKISFPLSLPDNWVRVTKIRSNDLEAFFVVQPTSSPFSAKKKKINHFLKKEASSTFKVKIKKTAIVGYEVGCNEVINNKGEQAGSRKIINTIMAWGGWLGLQNILWGKLTKFLVR